MSCLSIRLPTAKKLWKGFTSKLQTRLHKLHNSKAIKKPNTTTINRLYAAAAVASKTSRPSLFLGQRLIERNRRKRQRRCARGLPFGYQRYYFSKNRGAAPVYIDKLFNEAQVVTEIKSEEREKNIVKLIDDEGTSAEAARDKRCSVGDDTEESIGSASPMLHGIDARAEEFIASFRAEMERQEIIARHL